MKLSESESERKLSAHVMSQTDFPFCCHHSFVCSLIYAYESAHAQKHGSFWFSTSSSLPLYLSLSLSLYFPLSIFLTLPLCLTNSLLPGLTPSARSLYPKKVIMPEAAGEENTVGQEKTQEIKSIGKNWLD